MSDSKDQAMDAVRAIRELWPEYTAEIFNRLCVGAREYGDASFHKPIDVLAVEIEQEMYDVMGWGFILWCRLRKIRQAMSRLEE